MNAAGAGPGGPAGPRTGVGAQGRAPCRPRYSPFLLVSCLLLLLCIAGAASGHPGLHPLRLPVPTWWSGGDLVLPGGRFVLLHLATWAACLGAVLLFPRRLTTRRSTLLIFALAVACRLPLLLAHPASDDVNRYLWEGRALAAGISPYGHAPAAADDPAADFLRSAGDPIRAGVNHPEMTAIYPPMMLGIFAVVASLSYSTLAVKLVVVAFDLAALGVLLRLLRRRRLEPRWALFYAVNPVVLYGFAGQGHLDAVQCLLVLLAVHLYDRRRWSWMFLVAGLAVQVKYVALLGWPFLLRRDNWRRAWIAPVAALLPLAPFLALDGAAVFRSLLAFGYEMSVNGPLQTPLRLLTGSIASATAICQALLGAALLFGVWWFHPRRPGSPYPDPVQGWFFAFGAFLILSPTVHFWYLTWVIPFLALRPVASWTTLCGTIGFTFVASGYQHHEGVWRFPLWVLLAVWLIPLVLILRDLWIAARRVRGGMRWGEPRRMSVVVPALNEGAWIAGCVRALRADPAVGEVIVVDGGSRDDTMDQARASGARIVVHDAPPEAGGGRGGQIAAGCRVARYDIVAVVHADTRLSPGGLSRALELLIRNPDIVGGALGSVLDAPGWRMRLLDAANDARAAFGGISFGDQVQFFRREPLIDRGLVPELPLMEDVELSLRLHGLGRSGYLWDCNVVSARRWRSGTWLRSLQVVLLNVEYLISRLLGRADTLRLYRRYYGPRRGRGSE